MSRKFKVRYTTGVHKGFVAAETTSLAAAKRAVGKRMARGVRMTITSPRGTRYRCEDAPTRGGGVRAVCTRVKKRRRR